MKNQTLQDSCIFCEKSGLEVLIPGTVMEGGMSVFKCRDCGLVFLESRSGQDGLDPEEKTYWDSDEQKKIYLQEKIRETFVEEFKQRLTRMEAYLDGCGKLLDVGCGVGHFLDTAQRRGWKVKGLDISHAASKAAKEAHGLEVAVGTLEDNLFPPRTFDAITLWDVIEHIRRPLENTKAANRLLRPGGIIVMKTPDESSLFKRIALAFYRIFGRRGSFLLKYVYYVPHYFSYSRKTMTKLMEESGFEVIEYQRDETPTDFAVEKINAHYKKDSRRKWVIALLPLAQFAARLFKQGNKMIVYARKVKEI